MKNLHSFLVHCVTHMKVLCERTIQNYGALIALCRQYYLQPKQRRPSMSIACRPKQEILFLELVKTNTHRTYEELFTNANAN